MKKYVLEYMMAKNFNTIGTSQTIWETFALYIYIYPEKGLQSS